MKILHTADWHIGKILHLFDLEQDHRFFFNWLLETIKKEEIDVLVVAGDIFDHSNPTNESRKMYYELLKDLAELKIQVVITGGNHDSVNMLQASGLLLSLLNINVVAGVPQEFEKQIIELKNREGKTEVICAAVPFLRDKDLRSYVAGESSQDRIVALKEGIYNHFSRCKDLIAETYGKQYPTMATGHLYIQGAKLSDSEREIQIGNQAGVEADGLSSLFDYMALGHIHIANRYGNGKMRYSGSPLPLSFSEKEDEKIVIIVEKEVTELKSRSIKIPIFRKLIKLVGTWDEIKSQLEYLSSDDEPLSPLIELEIFEDSTYIGTIEKEITEYKNNGVHILKRKINSSLENIKLSEIATDVKKITEINPKEVFIRKLNASNLSEVDKALMLDAFNEIYEEELTKELV